MIKALIEKILKSLGENLYLKLFLDLLKSDRAKVDKKHHLDQKKNVIEKFRLIMKNVIDRDLTLKKVHLCTQSLSLLSAPPYLRS